MVNHPPVVHQSGGIGIVGLLTVVFVVLKLVGVISWSWWWVLAPLWIAFGLWLVALLALLVIGALVATFSK